MLNIIIIGCLLFQLPFLLCLIVCPYEASNDTLHFGGFVWYLIFKVSKWLVLIP